ncbi:kama family protein [Sporormia fimetaria CBS 119925]|uniref:Kama family protein n=1 Tax=Sporormia fimetaria CBS 119925 TaxID=1340428 RepID=A0A6A6VEF2_9PLEO|nr:kama family protein [Sporormia fimetaria CBS 119925]
MKTMRSAIRCGRAISAAREHAFRQKPFNSVPFQSAPYRAIVHNQQRPFAQLSHAPPETGQPLQQRIEESHRPLPTGERYWQKVPRWKDVTDEQFLSYRWQLGNTINNENKLLAFLEETLPQTLEPSNNPRLTHIKTKQDFIEDVKSGLKRAPMAVRLTPHVCSVIQWKQALDDPIRLQFLPLGSGYVGDHSKLTLDSLNEKNDSAVQGLVHRYPDKVLFLATSICPVYCRYCTRSYAVGASTDTVTKDPLKPSRKRWQHMYDYIERTPSVTDVVVSGGDTYYLEPYLIKEIGDTLLKIPHVRRIRFASRGLAVAPSRTVDPNDAWTSTFIELSNQGRELGKHVCLHTHFNHPNEITWVTKAAARHLFKHGVIVRNQAVLLKGVNDSLETMGELIRTLADINIQPYYVYQCDLVKGIEELRTPLSTILKLEQQLRGTIAGFMMPSFVVDLPGGGGKRLAAAHESYNPETGVSVFRAPGLLGAKGQKTYEYYDPKPTVLEAAWANDDAHASISSALDGHFSPSTLFSERTSGDGAFISPPSTHIFSETNEALYAAGSS